MKHTFSSRCRLLVALAVLFFNGFLAAQPSARPMLAQPQVFSSAQERSEPSSQRASYVTEMNTAAYVQIIVIPLLLFILMIGVVRRQDV